MARVLLAAALAATSLASAMEVPGPIASLSHCAFSFGERQYDLCPLFDGVGRGRKTVDYYYAAGSEIETNIVYQLSLDGPLENDGQNMQVRLYS